MYVGATFKGANQLIKSADQPTYSSNLNSLEDSERSSNSFDTQEVITVCRNINLVNNSVIEIGSFAFALC